MVCHIGKPIFSETLWEWRAFGVIDTNSLHLISNLPKRYDRSGNLKDDYLWLPECSVNVKLRDEGIRLKRLLSATPDGSIKQWITEAYDFPISIDLFNMILSDFKIKLPHKESEEIEKEIQNRHQLLSILQFASETFQVITVDKHREQYLWPLHDRNTGAKVEVMIEVANIHSPELLTSISIEHQDLDKVEIVLKSLRLPSKSLYVLSYLDCLQCWAYGKNCSKYYD
jgi:hypothetical protein